MDQNYYDAVTKMEAAGVDEQYMLGWMEGYLHNPKVEEQNLTDAYEAGYEAGSDKNGDDFGEWVK